jgi:hypothetical protein
MHAGTIPFDHACMHGQRKEAEITKLRRDLTTTALLEARINKLEELLKKSAKID